MTELFILFYLLECDKEFADEQNSQNPGERGYIFGFANAHFQYGVTDKTDTDTAADTAGADHEDEHQCNGDRLSEIIVIDFF